jgi:inosose dehydratase
MIKIANAPCSWGVLEFGLEGKTAGYTQVLDEMKEAGYAGTELGDWGFMPTDPGQLQAEVSRRGLALLGAFVPVDFSDPAAHAPGEKNALRVAELLCKASVDRPFVVLADDNGKNPVRTKNAGRIKPDQGLGGEQWKVFAAGVERIAREVQRTFGLRAVFHHHCAGFVETPGEVGMLMQLTDPDLVGLCLDMGHYRFGGGDPLQALRQFAPRIRHVHFKDCHGGVAAESRARKWDYFESVRQGVFCELGKGEVDFPAIAAELRRMKYNGWIVVEQDVLPGMGNPKECATRNRTYLRQLEL